MGIIQEYMFCCDIFSIYIDINYFDTSKNIEFRGKEDSTTRLQLFFRISNSDVFSMRIDMPHKGVDYFHINIHEPHKPGKDSSGLPFNLADEKIELINLCGYELYSHLFLEYEGKIWFKSHFIEKINELEYIDIEVKEKLQGLFRQQSHLNIHFGDISEEIIVNFMSELNQYLVRFHIFNINVITNNIISPQDEFLKIRLKTFLEMSFLGYYYSTSDNKDNEITYKNTLLDYLYNKFNCEKLLNIHQDEISKLELIDIFEYIFFDIYN